MFNCNDDLRAFHNKKVTLNDTQQSEMRGRRNANRKRLKRRLEANDDPVPDSHQSQGSYAMHTMVQDKNDDYDIDDGAVFLKEDLVGSQGADKTALDARKMVCSALDDGSFNTPPAVLKNCVRVFYKQGNHVDVPVYRQLEDGTLELASSDWKGSRPSEISEWYNNAVCQKSPDTTNGRQLRRVTRLIKMYKNSRESWKSKTASGFIISVLVVENYVADDRDDVSLYETMNAIYDRLNLDLEVANPVRDEMLTKGADDPRTKFFRERLAEALENLEILLDSECTLLDALKAWKNVFQHQFWKDLISTEEDRINEESKQKKAGLLREGNSSLAITAGLTAIAEKTALAHVKRTQAYGGKKNW